MVRLLKHIVLIYYNKANIDTFHMDFIIQITVFSIHIFFVQKLLVLWSKALWIQIQKFENFEWETKKFDNNLFEHRKGSKNFFLLSKTIETSNKSLKITLKLRFKSFENFGLKIIKFESNFTCSYVEKYIKTQSTLYNIIYIKINSLLYRSPPSQIGNNYISKPLVSQ